MGDRNEFEECMSYQRNPLSNRVQKIQGEEKVQLIPLSCGTPPEGYDR